MPKRHRLLLYMGIPALLLLLVGAAGVWSLDHLQSAAGRILADNYHSVRAAHEMERTLQELQARVLRPSGPGKTTGASTARLVERFAQALHSCERNITETRERRVLEALRADWEDLGTDAAAWPRDPNRYAGLFDSIDRLTRINEEAMEHLATAARRTGRLMMLAFLAAAGAALLALGLFAIVLARMTAQQDARDRDLRARYEESRRQFISMLSHQLKTPMTSLNMSLNLLREKLDSPTPAQAELLAIAAEDSAALANLMTELIQAARDVSPDLSLRPRRTELRRLLTSALLPLQPQAREKGLHLAMPDQGTPVHARVDPVKFPWVVTNIVGNALRYTPAGGTVEVRIVPGPDHLEVAVADTGRGLPPEALERIFVPFVSVDPERHPGTHGLGLAIAREVVEAHNGTIHAESAPGQGATFRIYLPADPTEAP